MILSLDTIMKTSRTKWATIFEWYHSRICVKPILVDLFPLPSNITYLTSEDGKDVSFRVNWFVLILLQ